VVEVPPQAAANTAIASMSTKTRIKATTFAVRCERPRGWIRGIKTSLAVSDEVCIPP
jgi:hypothetical protein